MKTSEGPNHVTKSQTKHWTLSTKSLTKNLPSQTQPPTPNHRMLSLPMSMPMSTVYKCLPYFIFFTLHAYHPIFSIPITFCFNEMMAKPKN